ncbi:MAG: HD domain-containing protein [bacterium]|nr:HD domain-containing protein [bacterium]
MYYKIPTVIINGMRVVEHKELGYFKILPFDLYNEASIRIFPAGEVLTPGKLIMLKNYAKLYTSDILTDKTENENADDKENNNLKKLTSFTFDTLDPLDFDTVTNKNNILSSNLQIKIKYFMQKTLDILNQGYYLEGISKLNQLSNIMMTDIFKQLFNSKKGSQIRFLGEYEICHPLNVAIISGLIAKKLEYTNDIIEKLVLAGLVHDIGKFCLKIENESPLLTTNETIVADHTILGYDLIKNKLGLEDSIAKAILEHHENNDGSGYPQGLSSETITEFAQIINVANFYDNLANNRTAYHIVGNRDVLRTMLDIGTKRFAAKILYTFIHMFDYDDSADFNDMML